jgi:tetratricopeptide (TPR) repeat protein
MEVFIERIDEAQARVTCDHDHIFSHVFDIPDDNLSPERLTPSQLMAYGETLYAALFPANSLAHKQLLTRPERLLLVATDPVLEAIPWEYSYGLFGSKQESMPGFLVLECAFVRGLPEVMRIPTPALNGGMHIVAVPSHPLSHALAPLNIDAEWQRLKEVICELPYAINLERTRPATLERTRSLVAHRKGSIVHFMGHGGQDGQGALLCFEKEQGTLAIVRAQEFIQRVRNSVFLVTLNACVSASPGPTPFSNLAAALARQKTPYALGMRFSIIDQDARDFSRTFYSELAQGTSIEDALTQARLTLANSERLWAIGVPILYTALTAPAPGFVCGEGSPTVKEHQPAMDVTTTLPRAEGIFQGRIEELQHIGQMLTGDTRPRILTIHAGGGQGKTALARESAERFAFAWPGGVWAISLEQLPTREIAVSNLAAFLTLPKQETADLSVTERLIQQRLAEKRTLLILDNFETLIEAVERKDSSALNLVGWLKQLAGPTVSLLVTSRTVLEWAGEESYELGGLTSEDGAALFRQSAPQRRDEIERNMALARHISERLDGHPLSLRLLGGAFNGTSAPLATFVQECEKRLLEAENKYVGPEHRHRKLYACLEASVRALEPSVAALLSGLWIFHAPFWASTAEKVFSTDDEDEKDESEDTSSPILNHLHILWQRGLLTRTKTLTRDGEVQFYYLLPTTRPYIEHHVPQTYDQTVLYQHFGSASRKVVRWLYDQLDSLASASLYAKEAQEDLERGLACLKGVERGYALCDWSWVIARLGDRLRALELLEETMEIAQGADEKLSLSASHIMAGVYSAIGKPEEALRLYEQALPIKREVGDRSGEGTTLNNMARVYRDIGKPEDALRLYEQALPIKREVGDRSVEGTILSNMALVYSDIGKPEEALRLYEQALPIRREVGDRSGEGTTLSNMAKVYSDIGKPEEALRLYEQALPIRREVGDRSGEGTILNNMAKVYSDIGKPEEALRLYEQALPIEREVGDRSVEGTILSNMAHVYQAIGKSEEALRLYEQALPIKREVRDRSGEGTTLNNMAKVYNDIGKPEEALWLYEQALPIKREVGDRSGEGTILNNMAGVYSVIGKPEEALRLYEQALPIRREVGDRSGEGVTLYNLASLYQDLQQYGDAARTFEEALLIFQQVFYVAGEIAVLVSIAIVYGTHLQRAGDAKRALERAIALFQSTGLPQDAARNTLESVQQLLLRLQRDGSLYQQEQGETDVLVQAIFDFVNAADWDASQQVVEAKQALLFQPEVEALFAQFIQQAKEEGGERVVRILEVYLALLRACQRDGIEDAFARLRGSQAYEE